MYEKYDLARMLMMYAHEGQVDKAGRPYYLHPLQVSRMVDGCDNKVVALLHDVVEDTNITIDTIWNIFGDTIADAVDDMTHRKGEPYFDYIARVKTNDIARTVKIADLTHNMDLSRLSTVTEKDRERSAKYLKAKEMLEE